MNIEGESINGVPRKWIRRCSNNENYFIKNVYSLGVVWGGGGIGRREKVDGV